MVNASGSPVGFVSEVGLDWVLVGNDGYEVCLLCGICEYVMGGSLCVCFVMWDIECML